MGILQKSVKKLKVNEDELGSKDYEIIGTNAVQLTFQIDEKDFDKSYLPVPWRMWLCVVCVCAAMTGVIIILRNKKYPVIKFYGFFAKRWFKQLQKEKLLGDA